jgi:phosphoribosylformylglycinamidine synthase
LISGKDSMKNDSTRGGVKISIPPTLLVSVIGVVDDVAECTTLDAKKPSDLVYIFGTTRGELGATEYLDWLGESTRGKGYLGKRVATVDPELSRRICEAVSALRDEGLARSIHAVGPGGLAVGLARIAMAGEIGLRVDVDHVPVDGAPTQAELLYSESGGRFVVTVAPEDRERIESICSGLPVARIGTVTGDRPARLEIKLVDRVLLDEEVSGLKQAWKETLDAI